MDFRSLFHCWIDFHFCMRGKSTHRMKPQKLFVMKNILWKREKRSREKQKQVKTIKNYFDSSCFNIHAVPLLGAHTLCVLSVTILLNFMAFCHRPTARKNFDLNSQCECWDKNPIVSTVCACMCVCVWSKDRKTNCMTKKERDAVCLTTCKRGDAK